MTDDDRESAHRTAMLTVLSATIANLHEAGALDKFAMVNEFRRTREEVDDELLAEALEMICDLIEQAVPDSALYGDEVQDGR